MFDEEDAQVLVKLGLNASQARIYLTLISLGVANAKKIAKTAEIDSGEVYRQLENLQEKTLVEKILSTPNQYKPLPLNETLRMLFRKKNRESSEIQKQAEALLRKGGDSDTLAVEENRLSIIPSDDYRVLYYVRAFESSQKEWIWYTAISRIPISIDNYYETMKKALDRGVRWRTIAELDKSTEKTLKFIQMFKDENPNFEIRFANPTLLVTFAIYDDKELSFSLENLTGLANSRMLTTNNEQLIKVVKDYFELRWKSARFSF